MSDAGVVIVLAFFFVTALAYSLLPGLGIGMARRAACSVALTLMAGPLIVSEFVAHDSPPQSGAALIPLFAAVCYRQ